MKEFLVSVFSDKYGNAGIELFNVWHILYLVLIIGATIGTAYLISKKSENVKDKVLSGLALGIIILYISDFFFHPFYFDNGGYMEVDKLPFHICTSTGILVAFVQFNKKFEKYKTTVSLVAIVASLMYMTYPGSALGGQEFYCYRIVQTFLYHGALFAYGILSATTGKVSFEYKELYKPLILICIIAVWATIGNLCYNVSYTGEDTGIVWNYGTHHYDWFFLTGTTFPFIPTFLMPLAVIVAVFGMCALITLIYNLVKKGINKKQ